MKPAAVAAIHHDLCAAARCKYLKKIDYSDPCARCPNGHFGPYQHCPEPPKKIKGLGDAVAVVATPIARALGLPCIDPKTQELRPESGCGKRQDKWNKVVPFRKKK